MRDISFRTGAKGIVLIFWCGTLMDVPNIRYSSIN